MSLLVYLTIAIDVFSLTLLSHASPFTGIVLKDCPEFDLMFENAFDQWVAGSAGEKCTFIQVLHHTCQRYSSARKPEFINCQSKLLGGKMIKNNAANWPLLGFLFCSAHSDFAMSDSLLSCYAVIQFDYAWWHPAPGIQENACILLTQHICWTFSWSEFSEDVQQKALTVTQDFRLTGSKHIIKLKALLNINLH